MTKTKIEYLFRPKMRDQLKYRAVQKLRTFRILAVALVFFACTTLPEPQMKTLTLAYEPHPDTHLAVVSRDLTAEVREGHSGFFKLFRNDAAMRWRLLLIEKAEETLDMQYFIWKADASGDLLLDQVVKAADCGVRVRILVDDVYLLGADRGIAALSQHPRIEARMFNPAKRRTGSIIVRGLEMMGNVTQMNHRMHNKLIVADNRMAIVGGRNLGNEYFGLNPKQNFTDFDVLAIGPVAKKVSASFDIYWNNQWAYPGDALLQNFKDEDLLSELREELREQMVENEELLVEFQQHRQDFSGMFAMLADNIKDGSARVIYDEPLIGEKIPPAQLIEDLGDLAVNARQELLISTPYFIPDEDFYETVSLLIKKGVRIAVLTNSLGSTNHPIVHSGYKKHRKKVIRTGGALFELRHDATGRGKFDTPPVRSKAFGLHAKYIVIDRRHSFVGSLNLDPRSIYINTEMGLLIDSPTLAQGIAREFEDEMKPENSWQVLLDEKGRLFWKSGDTILKREPARSFWQRFQNRRKSKAAPGRISL
jgi:putative cardiolipin synthase